MAVGVPGISLGSNGAFGYLCLFKNGEINFMAKSDQDSDYFDTSSVFRLRQEVRSNATSAIDVASATLSQTGKSTFSVRSGFFESIKSVRTPKSLLGTARTIRRAGMSISLDPHNKLQGKYKSNQ